MIRETINRKVYELFGNHAELVNSLISPAIGIKLKDKAHMSDHISSKIGGWPEVNEDFVWPSEAGYPLTFLCQLILSDVSQFQSILPSEGALYFFVANPQCQDFACAENAIKVIYVDNLTNAKPRQAETIQLDEYGIDFYEHYTLPSYQEKAVQDLDVLAIMLDELDELELFISELTYNHEDFTKHHMLGDPNAVQGSVRPYWANKLMYPEDTYYKLLSDHLDQASAIGDSFALLLQIDLCDERISLPLYGYNCLYFGIPKEDLDIKKFDRVKLVIQST